MVNPIALYAFVYYDCVLRHKRISLMPAFSSAKPVSAKPASTSAASLKAVGTRAALSLFLLAAASTSLAGDLTVSAAASLTNAFTDVAHRYESLYPDAKVALNFGASGALLQQMAKGAPVDVFASADQETMDQAEKQNLINKADRKDFVSNSLVVIVPADSKQRPSSLKDLTQPAIKRVAIGNPDSVPVGRYTRHALETAKLWGEVQPKAIFTQNVRQSLDYVARGEVETGFVYGTDAAVMKDKVNVAFSVPLDMPIRYPVATVKDSEHAAEAKRFVDFVVSPEGQAILEKHGFLKP
ncbi:Molybdenum ABC transporter, periplasmic molybdenum-binding protein [gamma proteobacterium HdN1]|nr:Molybdenum ABC transporter, periplasmic molybdenum-binding protein [gamma proteobacterium HdN1]